jgi:hypothetical protein
LFAWGGLIGVLAGGPAAKAESVGVARVTDVRVQRIEGLPDTVVIIFTHQGALAPERLRIYFDTVPNAGEPASGGDLMVEGPSLYAYPEGATGWAWKRIGDPVFQTMDGKLACVVTAPALGRPFSWFAEVTTADWNVAQRWPEADTVTVDPGKLTAMAPPSGAAPTDMKPLLAARAISLSVRLNGGPDLGWWTPLGIVKDFGGAAEKLKALGVPSTARLQATLRDAASGESAALAPARVWRRGEDLAWEGETLGVSWVLLAESPAAGELRLTGWLRGASTRVLHIETGLAMPLEGKTWADDMATSRVIESGAVVYGNFASSRFGVDGRQSFYPLAAIEDGLRTWVLETDPDEPRVFTLGADAGFFRAAYDMALSPETAKFPGQATFRCSFYTVPRGEENGFRAALGEFFRRHPDYAQRRVPRSGLWMPFTDMAKVPDAEDFGFSFFEKVGERGADVDYAAKHGVLTLMYTEPWLYWLPFDEGEVRTPEHAAEKMSKLAALGLGWSRDLAASGLAGATRDAKGNILTRFMDLPWNHGARMEVNTDPDLAPASPSGLNRAQAEWKRISVWLDDPRVDGIYLDSMDAGSQPDYAPAALRATDHPATYTRGGKEPVIAPNVPEYEFTAALSALLHSRGKYLMGNFPLVDSPFINRWIDIPGEETDWWSGGQYNQPARSKLDYRRALSGRKPFGYLQSTNFSTFEGEPLRRYFETCLFYGFQPSFFSHNGADNPYWQDAKVFERDRPLFRTFVPLARRVADAGWQPVREARLADPAGLRLEQFGRPSDGLWHLTFQNLTEEPRATQLVLPAGLGRVAWLYPLTGLGGWTKEGESVPVKLEAHATLLLDLVTPARTENERAFLRGWRSGGDEAAAALGSLESLLRENAAGIRAGVTPAGPVVAGDPSAWTLSIGNENKDTIRLRVPGLPEVSILAGETRAVRIVLPAVEGDTRRIAWNTVRADGAESSFVRTVRVRAVSPLEVTGPGARLFVRAGNASVPVRLENHSPEPRDCLVEWSAGAGSSQSLRVKLAGGATETARIPILRPAHAGAVTLGLKVSAGDHVYWKGECRVVFVDVHASLAADSGVAVSVDSTFGGYSPAPLNDGITDSENLAWNEGCWASDESPVAHWVGFGFPAPVTVGEVVIHWNHEGGITYAGREGVVFGAGPSGEEQVIAQWKSKPGDRATRITFKKQVLKAVRVQQNAREGAVERPDIMWVSEIEVN